MAALREIFARFGVAFETGPLARGEAQIQKVTAALGTFGIALGGAAIVHGLERFVGGIRESAIDLDRQASRLGLSAQAMQELGFAASASGRDLDDMVDAMATLQERARDAIIDPKSDPAQQLRLLGVSATDAGGNLKDAETLISEVASGLAGMGSQTDRVGAAMTLFGDVGRELLPTLQQGSEGIERMREEFRALGGGLSQETIDASVELTEAQMRLSAAFDGIRSRVGLFLLPALERLTNALTGLLSNRRKMEAFGVALGAIATVLTIKLLPALSALAVRSAGVLATWAPLLVAGAALYLVLEDIKTALEGGDSLFGSWTDAINDFITANQNANGVLGVVARTWRGLIRLMERGYAIADAIVHLDPSRLVAFDEARRNRGANTRRGFGSFGVDANGNRVPLATAPARAPAGGGAPNVTIQNNQQITGDSPAEIARQVERANRRTNREAVEALEGRAP